MFSLGYVSLDKKNPFSIVSLDIVVSGDVYSDVFVVKNALTWHIPEQLPAKGSRQGFTCYIENQYYKSFVT